MSSKVDLQRKLKEIGYEIGQFASKETLLNVLRLHTKTLETKGVDVAKLNDLDLRKNLVEHDLTVGPVTNQTRSIYQRKLLELLTNESSEGAEDEIEVEETTSKTPVFSTRSSIVREENKIAPSPVRQNLNHFSEARIALTRIDVDENEIQPIPSIFSQTKSMQQETITQNCSSQRQNPKAEIRSIVNSAPLRNPYDFHSDETAFTRHEHKATPFRTTNISSIENSSNNAIRSTKFNEPTTRFVKSTEDFNEIRSRILTNDENSTKSNGQISTEKQIENKNETKSRGRFFYASIAIFVGFIVFFLYLYLEN